MLRPLRIACPKKHVCIEVCSEGATANRRRNCLHQVLGLPLSAEHDALVGLTSWTLVNNRPAVLAMPACSVAASRKLYHHDQLSCISLPLEKMRVGLHCETMRRSGLKGEVKMHDANFMSLLKCDDLSRPAGAHPEKNISQELGFLGSVRQPPRFSARPLTSSKAARQSSEFRMLSTKTRTIHWLV